MSTLAQIQANRLNSALSTGPRTAAGKAASAQNATRHGLASAFKVLTHENQAEFDRLLEQFRDRYLPSDVVQHLLVDQLAQAQWRLYRAQRLQAVALDLLAGFEDPDNPDTRIVQAMAAKTADVITLLDRYAAQAERSFHKAHHEINAAKARELAAILQNRLTMADVDRVLEMPRAAHPSQSTAALQNKPNSPEPLDTRRQPRSCSVDNGPPHSAMR